MKFLFVVEAGPKVGMGHLRRSLALADSISQLGVEVYLNTSRMDSDLISILGKQTSLPIQNNLLGDGAWNIILDGYGIEPSQYESTSNKLHLITDFHHIDFEVDTLIDPNFDEQYFPNQQGISFSELHSGPEYVILGDNYWKKSETRDFVSFPKLLVTMGGSDPTNHTEIVLKQLLGFRQLFSEVGVVVGPFTKKLSGEIIDSWAGELTLHEAPKNLVELYSFYDVAIGAGGTSAYERINRNMPSINLIALDNQERVSKELEENNLAKSLDARIKGFELTEKCLGFLFSEMQSKKVRERGNTVVDGQGAERLAKLLVEAGIS